MIKEQKTVEERLARIEGMLDKISQGVNQAPSMVAIATDSMDEMIRNAGRDGVSFEESLGNGIHLLKRLADPKLSNALNNLIDIIEQGPGLLSIAMDTMDETIGNSNQGRVRLDDRINAVAHLLMRLSDPKIIEKLEGVVDLADQSSGLLAIGMDSFDELMVKNSKNLDFVKKLGEAFEEARNQEPEKVGGIFRLLRLVKDPDRQKALGFLMNILKQFGKKI
jgi:uncharacterized protein YjgD (DUF1641 family)